MGHEVTLVAATFGVPTESHAHDYATYTFAARRLGRGTSFAKIVSPSMVRWLFSHAREFDVAHVHMGRDFVSAVAARVLQTRNIPTVLQTHGMINPRSALPQRLVDAALVKPALRASPRIYCLNDKEMLTLDGVIDGLANRRTLVNGIALGEMTSAHLSSSTRSEVLFLARLHPRKGAVEFARTAQKLLAEGIDADFSIVGPDEGDGPAVDEIVAEVDRAFSGRLTREGPCAADRVGDRMARAACYVLPAAREPLGMTVLEALSVGVPVVVTEGCGAANVVREYGAGLVIGTDLDGLPSAIRRLVDNPVAAKSMGERGRVAVRKEWGIEMVCQTLIRDYRETLLVKSKPWVGAQ
jgi:glycosyltransferase involved in cell wall biosynthesis